MVSNRLKIKELLASSAPRKNIVVRGWVRSLRSSKNCSFIDLNDGSCLKHLQIVVDHSLPDHEQLKSAGTGACLAVRGDLVPSAGKGQKWEVAAQSIEILGPSTPDYPLQKKRHNFEFMRKIAHLRPRSNTFGAVFRVRSEFAYAIHDFFHRHGFVYIHTPIITCSDCEGAGEMFQVTTLDLQHVPCKNGQVDFSQDFFKKKTGLTVSGQLEGELFALALGEIYTFGPTFRAENSNTSRHIAEFWMIEPEMAFYDLQDNMNLAEAFLKETTKHLLEHCQEDLQFFDRFIERGLLDKLAAMVNSRFEVLTYTDAITILQKSGQKFEFPVKWGMDLQSEHERYLTEKHVKGPVFVIDYPKQIKAFYMRLNDDDQTVRAMDLLVPSVGEIIGGSQREERLEVLQARMAECQLDPAVYQWYLDSRIFGSAVHSGFGMGFARAVMYVTGMTNIRDVVPLPRVPGWAEF